MTWDELEAELRELVPVRCHEMLTEALLAYRAQEEAQRKAGP